MTTVAGTSAAGESPKAATPAGRDRTPEPTHDFTRLNVLEVSDALPLSPPPRKSPPPEVTPDTPLLDRVDLRGFRPELESKWRAETGKFKQFREVTAINSITTLREDIGTRNEPRSVVQN